MAKKTPFPTVSLLADEVGESWPEYDRAADATAEAERSLQNALQKLDNGDRLLTADSSLVLFGSFARYEMVAGSDYDWGLLIDGVVDNNHSTLARLIEEALRAAKLPSPGSSGTFGKMVFSHDLVHRIGGGADSNENLTRRMLMLLESRPFSLSQADSAEEVWENVLGNILERYFEEDVHFTPATRKVPRFLLNDLTRYWRTIGVDYAAKHREHHGDKWAMRNAKLRFSRKLLFASGFAFCLTCQLNPPKSSHHDLFGATDDGVGPFIEHAKVFSRTPPLEYLAAFVDTFVDDDAKRKQIARRVFGAYNSWLKLVRDVSNRDVLTNLAHSDAKTNAVFDEVRTIGSEFAKGLELLFFNRDRGQETDKIAKLTLQYIGF